MRITVGGVLFVAALGAAGYYAVESSNVFKTRDVGGVVQNVQDKIQTSMGLFKSASSNSSPEPLPLESVKPLTPVQEAAAPAAPVQTPAPVLPTAPSVVEQSAVTDVAPPAPVKPVVRRRRRRRVRKAKVAVAPVAAAPVPVAKKIVKVKQPKAGGDSLVGQSVILKLKNNREVKGNLLEQTTVAYKLELPGLGAFVYPVENVQGVRPAE